MIQAEKMEPRIKADYINPFIQSVGELFENMLDCPIHMGIPKVIEDHGRRSDVIGLVGLSGTTRGTIALRFPVETALKVISRMVGTEFTSVDASVIEGIGEVTNIVAGNRKVRFRGQTISLSLPTVVRGSICSIQKLENTDLLTVPFESELGDFSLIIAITPTVCPETGSADANVGSR